ncbi:MAG: putative nucleic acid-binding protein, contains PIN domain protein [halophilic archaeon J07HB67]|jgi:Predicted nucleic acid-binding protein, contains PIN domain|nr:MAG: putative nucleic acid-binding protein, contains PIN domain protein [halophilic archaeon J07HB67]
MVRVLVDASVTIAFADTDDEHHDRGRKIVSGIDHGDLPTGVVTHEALVETLNYINERSGHAKAAQLLDLFEESAHYRLPSGSKTSVGRGRAVFRQYPELSLGDAMQVAFMRGEEVDYIYSFDSDFDRVEGVTRVNAPTDPFV